ncbi:MAG: hypothetical protein ACLTBV_11175 [Enterocloster bolteae]
MGTEWTETLQMHCARGSRIYLILFPAGPHFILGPWNTFLWWKRQILSPIIMYRESRFQGTALLTTAVSRLCVNPHSENLDEAMEFVSYLSSEYYKREHEKWDDYSARL